MMHQEVPTGASSNVAQVREIYQRIQSELSKVIVGQAETTELLVLALLAGGHVLLEGVPGLAKTLMVRTLAAATGCEFARVQFTPDLMPSDVTGTSVFDPREATFHLRKGPVFANLLLADEINRTPPKTQAALLEAMEERQVTIDGKSQPLPEPFVVFATQNPVEYEGTYPLPEAQLDRFLFKGLLPYPSGAEELGILRLGSELAAPVHAVVSPKELAASRRIVEQIRIDDSILRYVLQIIRLTRQNAKIYLGASPRAGRMLCRAAQAVAAAAGRDFVVPDDVKQMAPPVLRHRLLLSPEVEIEGVSADQLIGEILQSVEVPR